MAGPDLSERLRGGLLGVALGEALGLPWAGRSPREIRRDRLLDGVGPTGPVTAAVLAGGTAAGGTETSRDESSARGVDDSSLDEEGGAEALAQALVIGWREPQRAERRAGALGHGFAAVLVADLAAWALQGRALYHVVADHAGDWSPPFRGVPLDDRAVVDALMAILHRHDDPADGMRAAVRLGGGATALLAALVGGILGSRYPAVMEQVPWADRVALPDEAALSAAVAALLASR
jgi:hypothetical protein